MRPLRSILIAIALTVVVVGTFRGLSTPLTPRIAYAADCTPTAAQVPNTGLTDVTFLLTDWITGNCSAGDTIMLTGTYLITDERIVAGKQNANLYLSGTLSLTIDGGGTGVIHMQDRNAPGWLEASIDSTTLLSDVADGATCIHLVDATEATTNRHVVIHRSATDRKARQIAGTCETTGVLLSAEFNGASAGTDVDIYSTTFCPNDNSTACWNKRKVMTLINSQAVTLQNIAIQGDNYGLTYTLGWDIYPQNSDVGYPNYVAMKESEHCLVIQAGSNIRILNVTCKWTYGDAISVNNQAQDVLISGTTAISNGRQGIAIVDSQYVTVQNSTVGFTSRSGIDIEPTALEAVTNTWLVNNRIWTGNAGINIGGSGKVRGVWIVGNTITDTGGVNGINVATQDGKPAAERRRNLVILNNHVDRVRPNGIVINDFNNVIVAGNVITTSWTQQRVGVKFLNARGLLAVINNTFIGACTPWIHHPITDTSPIRASNNVFTANLAAGDNHELCYDLYDYYYSTGDNYNGNLMGDTATYIDSQFIRGDLSCDNNLTAADLTVWDLYNDRGGVWFGVAQCADPDLDGDGDVDSADRTILVGLIP